MSTPTVTLIITSHSNKDQLVRCLESVYVQTFEGSIQIIVADNNSSDNSMLIVTSRYPQVRVIIHDTNKGTGAALNRGIAATEAQYIAVLHQDTELTSSWVERMVQALESNPQVGSACSQVTTWKARGARTELESVGIGFRDGHPVRLAEGASLDSPKLKEAHRVFGAPGCAAMHKRKMLDRVALDGEIFDEDLFVGYEDYDIALRAFLYGYTTMYAPGTSVLHKRGALREKDYKATAQRAMLDAVNPALVLTKCLPGELLAEYGGTIRRQVRRNCLNLVRRYGPGAGLSAYRRYRTESRKMLKKNDVLFDAIDVNPKALEWEVFGRK